MQLLLLLLLLLLAVKVVIVLIVTLHTIWTKFLYLFLIYVFRPTCRANLIAKVQGTVS